MITYEKDGDGDLPQIIDIMRPLRLNLILQNAAALRHTSLDMSHYHPRSHYTDSPLDVPTTDQEFDRAAKTLDLGRWIWDAGFISALSTARRTSDRRILRSSRKRCSKFLAADTFPKKIGRRPLARFQHASRR